MVVELCITTAAAALSLSYRQKIAAAAALVRHIAGSKQAAAAAVVFRPASAPGSSFSSAVKIMVY